MEVTYIAIEELKSGEYSMYKVLIVDDDETIRYALRRFPNWESYGFTVDEEAHSGKEGLEKISEKAFDVVISDIRMPAMDGLEFLSKLKARNLDSCLVLLSTYNDFEYAQQGIRLGVFDYIIKPVEENALCGALKRIKRHLDEKKLQQSMILEEKEKLIEDNLEFYYPKLQERKLIDFMMAGNYEVIQEASSTCVELFRLMNQDLLKTNMLLEKMLLHLHEEMYIFFPWLVDFEKPRLGNVLVSTESFDDSKVKFLTNIKAMLEVVKKYELHHSDIIVRATCQYVLQHVEEDITLGNIANEVYVSKGYVGRVFKQKTGIGFAEYVTKVKMEHAKYLLGTGNYKIYEISEKLGYSRPDYFGYLFKDHTGYTAEQFRKMNTHNCNGLEKIMLDKDWGVIKADCSDNDIMVSFQIRMAIEPLIAELIIEQLNLPQFEKITELFTQQVKYYNLFDADAFIKIDQKFHQYLTCLSGNKQLIEVMNNQSGIMRYLGIQAVTQKTRYQKVLEEHTEIIEALKSRNLKRVHKAMEYHVLRTQEAVNHK